MPIGYLLLMPLCQCFSDVFKYIPGKEVIHSIYLLAALRRRYVMLIRADQDPYIDLSSDLSFSTQLWPYGHVSWIPLVTFIYLSHDFW